MFDLEMFENTLRHNNKLRNVFSETRALFKGRTDEDAGKILASCDRNEARIDKKEKEGIKALWQFLQRTDLFKHFENRKLQIL